MSRTARKRSSLCDSAIVRPRASITQPVDLELDEASHLAGLDAAKGISGYVLKRVGAESAFKRRWAVLQGCKLLWYHDEHAPAPTGWLDLRGAAVTQAAATKGQACVRVTPHPPSRVCARLGQAASGQRRW